MDGTGSAALPRPSEYIILRRIQFIAELVGLYPLLVVFLLAFGLLLRCAGL